jgi:lipopolysaccharide export system permease protein
VKKLDWYILKKFLRVFFFSIFLFAVIAVVIDISEKTDDFVRTGLSATEIFTQLIQAKGLRDRVLLTLGLLLLV